MRNSLVSLIVTAALASMLEAGPAFSQSTAEPSARATDVTPLATVAEWDAAVDGLRRSVWRVQQAPLAATKDSRGRTVVDDMNEYILPADAAKRVDELREQARSKESDATAVESILAQVRPILLFEAYKLNVIGGYWAAYV